MPLLPNWWRRTATCCSLALSLSCGADAAPVARFPLSADAQRLLASIRQTSDNGAAPFLVLDKKQARVWVFDAHAHPVGSAAVLLGLAVGDDSVPGIGERPLSQILPDERTTPAGRFVIEPGFNLGGDDILWIDYDAAVSIHRVRAVKATERRLQRLASSTAADNRISFGCINVPVAFYDRVLSPLFGRTRGVAYLIPETRPLESVFGFTAQPPRRP